MTVNNVDPTLTLAVASTEAGVLDASFGVGGLATADFISSGYEVGADVAIQPDGKIVAVGRHDGADGADFGLVRYNTDGSLDTAFGTGGQVTTDFDSTADYPHRVAIQSDGKIVVAGRSSQPSGYDIAVARYHSDGSLDNSFGTGGKLTTAVTPYDDSARGLALQVDGKIVVVGDSYQAGSSSQDFTAVRYHSDGSLDATFGTGGMVTVDFGSSYDSAYGVSIQPDGKIVIAGISNQPIPTGSDFAVARLNVDGSLDTTFDVDGKVTTDFDQKLDQMVGDVVIQSDEKIVICGGSTYGGNSWNFALVRYNTDGSPDAGFGSDGRVTTNFGANSSDRARDIALQSDGKIVVAGHGLPGATRVLTFCWQDTTPTAAWIQASMGTVG